MNRPRQPRRRSRAARRSEEQRIKRRPSGKHSAALPTSGSQEEHTRPASSCPPSSSVSELPLRTSQLIGALCIRFVLHATQCHPSLRTFPDTALMEEILRDSRDRSDTAYHLLE